jgi:DNA repair exonuclease SbcCD ATPase subunit
LAALPAAKTVKVDETACRDDVGKYDDAVAMLARKRPEAERRRSEAATLAERVAGAQREIARCKEEIEANRVPDERVTKATRRLAEHEVARLEIARLEGEKAGAAQVLRKVKEDLAAVRARLARGRRARQAAAVVERVYNAMHWSALPNRVAQINLGRMVGAINDGLGRFANPYWVEADDKLSFIAHKPGEPPQSAERLSTGQKVVLGLCFWPAVAALWAADLGVLCLDEPTANLDQDNRALLGEALTALSQQVRGRRQVVMITHDHELRSCFDQVVEL